MSYMAQYKMRCYSFHGFCHAVSLVIKPAERRWIGVESFKGVFYP